MIHKQIVGYVLGRVEEEFVPSPKSSTSIDKLNTLNPFHARGGDLSQGRNQLRDTEDTTDQIKDSLDPSEVNGLEIDAKSSYSSFIPADEDLMDNENLSGKSIARTLQRAQEIRYTGHVSSLAVLHDYRRHGIAKNLMDILHVQMKKHYSALSSTLHVRCQNKAAQRLYLDTLGYNVVEVVHQYYQDGADAFFMRLDLPRYTAKCVDEKSITSNRTHKGYFLLLDSKSDAEIAKKEEQSLTAAAEYHKF